MPKVQAVVKGKIYKVFRADGTFVYVDKHGKPLEALMRWVDDSPSAEAGKK